MISIHAPRVGCDQIFATGVISSLPFQSTHPAWGATRRQAKQRPKRRRFQSTHPAWGATGVRRVEFDIPIDFNPRTPRGVRRQVNARQVGARLFQSTHPAWGATTTNEYGHGVDYISIHAPRVGCDALAIGALAWALVFQSTHPAWGATITYNEAEGSAAISIHAPRVGCDPVSGYQRDSGIDFNPRTPRGVRPVCVDNGIPSYVFQSTHPAWGATSDSES